MAVYPYKEQHLSPEAIQAVLIECYGGQTESLRTLAENASALHIKKGGLPTAATCPKDQIKYVVNRMVSQGLAERIRGRHGYYKIAGESLVNLEDTVSKSIEDVPLAAEIEIGVGAELVYAYCFQAYRDLAEMRGHTTWPIKVGVSSRTAAERIREQIGTGHCESPSVLIAFHHPQGADLEKYLHSVLKLKGKHIGTAPGNEWFDTNPEELQKIYHQLD